MKWAYAIRQRMTAAILLATVFILVLSKNFSEKHQLSALGSSFSSVYQDRLVAESYIYRLSDHLYQKKMLLGEISDPGKQTVVRQGLQAHNTAIGQLIADYRKTKLTTAEAGVFGLLQQQLRQMEQDESRALEAALVPAALYQQFDLAIGHLHRLSRIQLDEGRLLNDQSRQRIAGASLLSEVELVVLIAIGLMIQGLLFASRSVLPRQPGPASLN